MHAKRSLVGISQETIDQMFRSFDLESLSDHILLDVKNITDKWLLSWMLGQPEVKVYSLNLKNTASSRQKEMIGKNIQSGIIKCCIEDPVLAEGIEKFFLKVLTLDSFSLSPDQRKFLNVGLLPKLRAEKKLWSSESVIEMIYTLFSIQLVFESQHFDEIIFRTLTTAEKLNTEHESKIARLDDLMLDRKLVLQFGSQDDPFKNASFLYTRVSERVYADSVFVGKPSRAKALKAIYEADVLEGKSENYVELAKRYENLSKKSIENSIIELNDLAKEIGIDDLIMRTNERLPEENFAYLNPDLYCKKVEQIRKARKQQVKSIIKR